MKSLTCALLLPAAILFTGCDASAPSSNPVLYPKSCANITEVAEEDTATGDSHFIWLQDIKTLCTDSQIAEYNRQHSQSPLPFPSWVSFHSRELYATGYTEDTTPVEGNNSGNSGSGSGAVESTAETSPSDG